LKYLRNRLVFVMLALSITLAQAQTMKQYESAGDGFRVSWPGEPTVQKNTVPTDKGPFELRTYLVEVGETALYVGVCDYGSAVNDRSPDAILQGAEKGALDNVKAHIIGEHKLITLQGNKGLEFIAENDTMHFTMRIYFVAGRNTLYQTLTAAPINNQYAGAFAFMDSFELARRTQ